MLRKLYELVAPLFIIELDIDDQPKIIERVFMDGISGDLEQGKRVPKQCFFCFLISTSTIPIQQ